MEAVIEAAARALGGVAQIPDTSEESIDRMVDAILKLPDEDLRSATTATMDLYTFWWRIHDRVMQEAMRRAADEIDHPPKTWRHDA